MIDWFEKKGLSREAEYISIKLLDNFSCTLQEGLKLRLKEYRKMSIGSLAPDIQLSDNGKGRSSLYQLPADTVVVAFWAAWCPHCQKEMPGLNQWATRHPGIKVLAVSLDSDSSLYNKSIEGYNALQHYCDFKKWESQPVKNYFILATPTFVVLDGERKIVGKFASMSSLRKYIK